MAADTDIGSSSEPDLRAPEEEFLTHLLAGVRRAAPAPSHRDVAATVRYLCGALSRDDSDGMVRVCASSPGARRQLMQVDSELQSVRRMSWARASGLATGDDLRAEVAAAWLELCRERAPAVARAAETAHRRPWPELLSAWKAGLEGASAAAFNAFARQFSAQLRSPSFAIARGEEAGRANATSPDDLVEVFVEEVRLGEDGALHVVLQVSAPGGSAAEGREVFVDLTDETASWNLGSVRFAGGRAELTAEGVGERLGLPSGLLPQSAIRIRFANNDFAGPTPEQPWKIPALAEDASGDSRATGQFIEVLEMPRWRAGTFEALVRVPQALRALHPSASMAAYVPVTESDVLHVGAWPLSSFSDAPRTIAAGCPDSADAALSDSSCLTFRIILAAGEP